MVPVVMTVTQMVERVSIETNTTATLVRLTVEVGTNGAPMLFMATLSDGAVVATPAGSVRALGDTNAVAGLNAVLQEILDNGKVVYTRRK